MAFPATPVIDAFTYSNGSLPTVSGGIWLNPVALPFTVVSNQIQAAVGGSINTRSDINAAEAEAYFTIATLPVAPDVAAAGWVDGSGNGYDVYYEHGAPGIMRIRRSTAYAPTTLGADISLTLSAGDGIGIRVRRGAIEAYHRSGGTWTLQGSRSDSTYTTARTLAVAGSGTTMRIDDYGGGAIAGSGPLLDGGLINHGALQGRLVQ